MPTPTSGGAVAHRAAAAYLEQLAAAEAAVRAAIEYRDQLAAARPAGVTIEEAAAALGVSIRGLHKRLAGRREASTYAPPSGRVPRSRAAASDEAAR